MIKHDKTQFKRQSALFESREFKFSEDCLLNCVLSCHIMSFFVFLSVTSTFISHDNYKITLNNNGQVLDHWWHGAHSVDNYLQTTKEIYGFRKPWFPRRLRRWIFHTWTVHDSSCCWTSRNSRVTCFFLQQLLEKCSSCHGSKMDCVIDITT